MHPYGDTLATNDVNKVQKAACGLDSVRIRRSKLRVIAYRHGGRLCVRLECVGDHGDQSRVGAMLAFALRSQRTQSSGTQVR
jgi:hypothetical protein